MFPKNLSSRSDLEMSVGLVKNLLVYIRGASYCHMANMEHYMNYL